MSSDAYVIAIDLPPDAVVEYGILVVSFFDTEGVMRYGVQTRGQAHLNGVVGLLEIAKVHLMSEGEG